MRRFDVPRRQMRHHRIAVITPLAQNGIAPETRNLGLVTGPVLDMAGKDRAKLIIRPHACIENSHNPVNFQPADVETRRQGQTTHTQTSARVTIV